MTKSISHSLASFIRQMRFAGIPSSVVALSHRALADYVAVTIGGAEMPVSQRLQGLLASGKREEGLKIFGTEFRAGISEAVLLNGTAAHALDYDDVSWTTIGHPSVTVAPIIFAYGELFGRSGPDLITSYVTGVEVQHRLAAALMPEVSDRGWHTTSVFGAVGAAAASAKMRDFDETTTANALGIAASFAGGVRANFGSMTKAAHAGMACQQGATAADWAEAGVTASDNVYEARDGYSQLFSGRRISVNDINLSFESFDLETAGLVFKKYPCCSGSHTAIDAMESLMLSHKLEPTAIESIDVGVSVVGPRELVCHRPTNAVEAKFSMQYALAAKLFYGKVTLDEFCDDAVRHSEIQSLMAKIHMFVDKRYDSLGFMNTSPSNVRVQLKSGEVLHSECQVARGNPENPLSDEEFFQKFVSCTKSRFNEGQAQRLFEATMQLKKYSNIKNYIELL